MTKFQKDLILLQQQVRKLERENRELKTALKKAENGVRFWRREFNRVEADLNKENEKLKDEASDIRIKYEKKLDNVDPGWMQRE